jgi:prepilin-type N-terminal cleavage/methylation domain-containing protein
MVNQPRPVPGCSTSDRTFCVRGAFSLIELIIVAAIVAVLAAISIPRFASSSERYRAESAARRLAADMISAREHAANSSAPVKITLSAGTGRYTITEQRLGKTSVRDLGADPFLARFEPPSPGSVRDQITFNGHGMPDSPSCFIVRVGRQRVGVFVDAAGSIRVGTFGLGVEANKVVDSGSTRDSGVLKVDLDPLRLSVEVSADPPKLLEP